MNADAQTCGARIFYKGFKEFRDVETCSMPARWSCTQTELAYCDRHMHPGIPGCCHLTKREAQS